LPDVRTRPIWPEIPSLLQFDKIKNEELVKANLQTLYGIDQAPSDTYLRERLDEVDPKALRKPLPDFFLSFNEEKGLKI